MANEDASISVAAIASRGLVVPLSLTWDEIQAIADSDVTQAAVRRLANALRGGEEASRRVASIAARGLQTPGSLTAEEIQTLCRSALMQANLNAMAPKMHSYDNDLSRYER